MKRIEQFTLSGASDLPIIGTIDQPANKANANVIFIHGFKGFKDWGAHHLSAEYFAQNDLRFIRFNMSHSGVDPASADDISLPEIFARNTFTKELADIKTVISYVKYMYPDEPIYLIGHSRGGGLALITAFEEPLVAKIATWASLSDFRTLWAQSLEDEWKQTGRIYTANKRTGQQLPLDVSLLHDLQKNASRLDILNAAAALRIPWLIVHGSADPGVPFSHAEQLYKVQPSADLLEVKNGDHVFGAMHPYKDEMLPEHLELVCKETADFFLRGD